MTMSSSGKRLQSAEINVTPMIDVLLVLIIIFMVITPLTPTGLRALLPQPPAPDNQEPVRAADIVITVEKHGRILLNGDQVNLAALPEKLRRVFQMRGNQPIFVRGARDLEFWEIAQVIDMANGAGLHRVALMSQ